MPKYKDIVALKSIATGKYITNSPSSVLLDPITFSDPPKFVATLTSEGNGPILEEMKFRLSSKLNGRFSFQSIISEKFLSRCEGCIKPVYNSPYISNFATLHINTD
jgi:hypothetical protein